MALAAAEDILSESWFASKAKYPSRQLFISHLLPFQTALTPTTTVCFISLPSGHRISIMNELTETQRGIRNFDLIYNLDAIPSVPANLCGTLSILIPPSVVCIFIFNRSIMRSVLSAAASFACIIYFHILNWCWWFFYVYFCFNH